MIKQNSNTRLAARLKRISPEIKDYVNKSHAVVDRIYELLAKKNFDQKQLATGLAKHESEISKILSGDHNPTLKTLFKIETFLGEEVLHVTSDSEKSAVKPKYIIIHTDDFYTPKVVHHSGSFKSSTYIPTRSYLGSAFTKVNVNRTQSDFQLAE